MTDSFIGERQREKVNVCAKIYAPRWALVEPALGGEFVCRVRLGSSCLAADVNVGQSEPVLLFVDERPTDELE